MRVNDISSLVEKIVVAFAAIAFLGGTISVAPALGREEGYHKEERHDRGWHKDHHRGRDWREHRGGDVYNPAEYAPPPVVAVPPPPSPGINLIFPIHIR